VLHSVCSGVLQVRNFPSAVSSASSLLPSSCLHSSLPRHWTAHNNTRHTSWHTSWQTSHVMAHITRHGTRHTSWHTSHVMAHVTRHGTRPCASFAQCTWIHDSSHFGNPGCDPSACSLPAVIHLCRLQAKHHRNNLSLVACSLVTGDITASPTTSISQSRIGSVSGYTMACTAACMHKDRVSPTQWGANVRPLAHSVMLPIYQH
jgi:hypothetical protein